MPDVSGVSSGSVVTVPATSKPAASATRTGSDMGKQDFLKLLVAQMRNQDPMKPMEDRDFMAQMAQFSALEATQHLSATLERAVSLQVVSQTGALVGKQVEALSDEGEVISGEVESVTFAEGDGALSPRLVVNGAELDLNRVMRISAAPAYTAPATPTTPAPAAGTPTP